MLRYRPYRGFLSGSSGAIFAALLAGAYYFLNSRRHKQLKMSSQGDIQLVIDIGSSSIRCCAFHINATPFSNGDYISPLPDSLARVPSDPFIRGRVDVGTMLASVTAVVDECIRAVRKNIPGAVISKIGFSSLAMNIFGVDQGGNPVTLAYTYACGLPEGDSLENSASPKERLEHYRRTGTVLGHPSYASVHLRDFYSASNVACVHKWTTFSSYIIGLWTGLGTDCPVSLSEASWWGLLSVSPAVKVTDEAENGGLFWDSEAISRIHPSFSVDNLPHLCDFNEFTGKVSGAALDRWPELSNAQIFLGIGDGAAANIGSSHMLSSIYHQKESMNGGWSPAGVITVGTSAAVRVVVPAPGTDYVFPIISENSLDNDNEISTPLWKYRVDRNRCLVGGALTDGGSLVDWFGRCFGEEQLQRSLLQFDETVCREEDDSTWCHQKGYIFSSKVPTILPFWSGERSTGWHANASGVIAAITRDTTPDDILYALFEGIAIRLDKILLELRNDGCIGGIFSDYVNGDGTIDFNKTPILAASGGALEGSNNAFCQLLADLLGYTIALAGTGNQNSPGSCSRGVKSYFKPLIDWYEQILSIIPESMSTVEATSLGVIILMNGDNIMTPGSSGCLKENRHKESSEIRKYFPRPHMNNYYRKRIEKHDLLYNNILVNHQ